MEGSAPGPVDPNPHLDPAAEPSGAVDPRAVELERARAIANGTAATSGGPPPPPSSPAGEFFEYENPAGAVIVTELQRMNRKLDTIGTAAMAGIYLAGMLLGLAIYYYSRGGVAVKVPPVE